MEKMKLMSIEEYFKSIDIEKFIKFLKKNKAYDNYMLAYKKDKSNSDNVNDFLNNIDYSPNDFILCAFYWGETGTIKYWSILDDLWEKELS